MFEIIPKEEEMIDFKTIPLQINENDYKIIDKIALINGSD